MPQVGLRESPFGPVADNIGSAGPQASRQMISQLTAQREAAKKGLDAIGDKLEALDTQLPADTDLRANVAAAREILGNKKGPEIDSHGMISSEALRREGIERLRAIRQSPGSMTGSDLNDVGDVEAGLKAWLYTKKPAYQTLMREYAQLSGQKEAAENLLERAQGSLNRTQGAAMLKDSNVASEVPTTVPSLVAKAAEKAVPYKPRAADFITRVLMQPGGSEKLAQLQAAMPSTFPSMTAAMRSVPAPATMGVLQSLFDRRNSY
jgi:hypothetical protein